MGRMAFRSIFGNVSKLELRKEAPSSASDSTEELGNLEKSNRGYRKWPGELE